MNFSEPIPLDLTPSAWVYRLWNADGDCLYVGQHAGFHPANRVKEHRDQPWWNEATRADYVEVLEGDLDIAEKQQIHDLNALYNLRGKGPQRVLITASVDKNVVKQFRDLAKQEDRPFSRFINDAMIFWLLAHDTRADA
jgi:hypothetical protein